MPALKARAESTDSPQTSSHLGITTGPSHLLQSLAAAVRLGAKAAPWPLAAVAGAGLIQASAPVATAWITRSLTDTLVAHRNLAELTGLLAAFAVVGMIRAPLAEAIKYWQGQFNRTVGLHAQNQLYAAMERQHGLRRFEDPDFQDRLRLAQQSAGAAAGSVTTDLAGVVSTLATIVGLLASIAAINTLMAVIIVAATAPVLLADGVLARRRTALAWMLSPLERREFFFGSLLANAQAAKEIRLFGAAAFLRERMIAERSRANRMNRHRDLAEIRVRGILSVLSGAIATSGVIWAAFATFDARLTLGDFTMFLTAATSVQVALAGVSATIARTYQHLTLFGHYREVTAGDSDLPVRADPVATPVLRTGIELTDVWFRYAPSQDWTLRGVNLFIPAGASVALVGRNGSGKSTLVKLLCRLYDPERGQVLWDGVDVRTMDPAELRGRITAIFQDFMQYDLTGAENIAIGDVSRIRDRSHLARAARTAGVHGTLAALPQGYDTDLTVLFRTNRGQTDQTNGVLLSGGQWQRVAMARALMRGARDLMILDEPTSGLDAAAEYELHQTIQRHCAASARVLVSHRMGSLRHADHIIVLAGGQIIERGTHASLMASGGEYADLYQVQAAGYVDPPAAADLVRQP